MSNADSVPPKHSFKPTRYGRRRKHRAEALGALSQPGLTPPASAVGLARTLGVTDRGSSVWRNCRRRHWLGLRVE